MFSPVFLYLLLKQQMNNPLMCISLHLGELLFIPLTSEEIARVKKLVIYLK